MGGIAGFAPRPNRPFLDASTLQRMTSLLAHRGPDAEALTIDRGFGLGHRRLSTIDVADGDQPLEDHDQTVSVVFDGEIYNHLDLRTDLEARGARPRTRNDGEVIVHGYLAFGLMGMLERLRGMYAFALYDRRARLLHLARDPFGIKPLFHSTTTDGLVFGSEIKAIVGALPGPWALSKRALLQSATLGFTVAPETIFERVLSLPPGHVATWNQGLLSVEPHHELAFAPGAEADDPRELWHQLRQSVDRHMMSEVPLGALLSGGLDSAAVVKAMTEVTDNDIDAIVVDRHASGMDEREHARTVSSSLRAVRLLEETVEPSIANLLPRLAWHLDQPFADSSAAPSWLLAEAARRHVKVVLSGDGGDENFAGHRRTRYDVFQDHVRQLIPEPLSRHVVGPLGRIWPHSPKLPPPLRAGSFLQNISSDWLDAYIHAMARIPESRARSLLRPEATGDEPLRESFVRQARKVEDLPPLSRVLALDFRTWLADDILVKIDRMSMAHGLEVRIPLLDTDFVSYAARLPETAKLQGGRGKQLFRHALRGRLPNRTLNRPKQGFGLPLDAWLSGPLHLKLQALMRGRSNPLFDYVDADVVAVTIEEHAARLADHSVDLWFILVLDAFLQHGPQVHYRAAA